MDISKLQTSITSEDPETALRAVLALRRLADQLEADAVKTARRKGWSWDEIGDALGMSRQAAHKKYRKE
jgi:hypothetical protein